MSRIIRITESQLRSFIMESLEEDIVKKCKENDNTIEYWFDEKATQEEIDDRIESDNKKRRARMFRNEEPETMSLQDRLKDSEEVNRAKRIVAAAKKSR